MNTKDFLKRAVSLSLRTLYAPLLLGVLSGIILYLLLEAGAHGASYEAVATLLSSFWLVGSLHVLGKTARGEKVDLFDALFVGVLRTPSFLLAFLILVFIVVPGLLLLVVPGFYALCRWGFAPFIAASDNVGVAEAYRRAESLSEGRLKLIGRRLSLAIGLQFGFQLLVMFAFQSMIQSVGLAAVLVFFAVAWCAAMALGWLQYAGVMVTIEDLSDRVSF